MRANSDIMGFAEADDGLHDEWVAGVEAAGNIGLGDVGEEFFVWTLRNVYQFPAQVEEFKGSVTHLRLP